MTDAALASGVVAVVRLPQATDFGALGGALAAGGVSVVEITLTTPGALEGIRDLASRADRSGCIVGAGSVLDAQSARDVLAAGARFVVSPTLDAAALRVLARGDCAGLPGAVPPR